MKGVYPVFISEEEGCYLVHIPDFDIDTEGTDLADAIFMARDAIGIMGIQYEDDGKEIPMAGSGRQMAKEGDITTLVDVDFVEYRRKYDNRMVKKNCTIPFSLCEAAEKAGINFSNVLREALKEKLNLIGEC